MRFRSLLVPGLVCGLVTTMQASPAFGPTHDWTVEVGRKRYGLEEYSFISHSGTKLTWATPVQSEVHSTRLIWGNEIRQLYSYPIEIVAGVAALVVLIGLGATGWLMSFLKRFSNRSSAGSGPG